jgi:UDP-xylose:glucoside alpha-1,3-xylosyltransferase
MTYCTLFNFFANLKFNFQELLTDVDALIYVDTDVLFLSPVDEIWAYFHKFNSTQLAALANEHEDKAIGWYNRFARHPYYGVTGKILKFKQDFRPSVCFFHKSKDSYVIPLLT